jgi:hypothetical protein
MVQASTTTTSATKLHLSLTIREIVVRFLNLRLFIVRDV